jgi:hypothetical protein
MWRTTVRPESIAACAAATGTIQLAADLFVAVARHDPPLSSEPEGAAFPQMAISF